MASFGIRRTYGLLTLLANLQSTVSQITAPVDVVGYIVEDDTIATSVTCGLSNYQVYRNPETEGNGPYVFCDTSTKYWMATACTDKSVLLYVTTESLESAVENTFTCDDTCTSLSVVQNYPSGGETWMIYDCLTFMPVPANVDVVYETLPDSVSFTTSSDDSETTSDSDSSSDADTTTDAESTRTTESSIRETESADSTESESGSGSDNSDDGPNVPVIVGATVGSVAGVALIIAAIFIGIRIGKKKKADGAGTAGSPPNPNPQPQMAWSQGPNGTDPNYMQQMPPMASSPPLDKYGGPPVAMAHPMHYSQSYMPQDPYQQQMPQQVPQGYYPPQGYHHPESYSPQPSQPSVPTHSELPTGQSSQGWASSEDHPHPYEMEAAQHPVQRNSPLPH